jgi:hypothetical protein
VHGAVGPDFVLNVGDILYFTGMVKEFGKFCAENGLEVVTSDHVASAEAPQSVLEDEFDESANPTATGRKQVKFAATVKEESDPKKRIERGPTTGRMIIDAEQTSKRRLSILGPETDKLQAIIKMTGKFISRPDDSL